MKIGRLSVCSFFLSLSLERQFKPFLGLAAFCKDTGVVGVVMRERTVKEESEVQLQALGRRIIG